jgi:DNA-binding NarL/FixJ family response regulator
MIRLLVADDHPVVRQGIKSMILENEDMQVSAEAADGDAVLEQLAATPVDAVLLDISMPGPRFPDVVRTIRERHPNLPILVLSAHAERDHAMRALKLGAAGFLQKDCAPEELAEAIRRVAGGRRYVSAALAELLAGALGGGEQAPHQTLSDRELRVLCMAASGKSVKQIAAELSLSPKTVSTFRSRFLRKLGLRTHAEAIRYALLHGLAE